MNNKNFYFLHVQARHYCLVNSTVPVLQRYFGGEDTRLDFRLGREAIHQLLVSLKTERQHEHGWGPTLETLVFQFWLASGSAYRIISRVFDMPLPMVHRVVHRMADEVVAVLPQYVCLPWAEEVVAVGDILPSWQGTGLLRGQLGLWTAATFPSNVLAALMVTTTRTGSCSHPWCFRQCVTIRVALLIFSWVTQEVCMMHASSRTAPSTLRGLTLHLGISF